MIDARTEVVDKLRQAVKQRKVKFLVAIPTFNEVDNIQELIGVLMPESWRLAKF